MAAFTWCRFHSMLNGIRNLSINHSRRHISSMDTKINQMAEDSDYPNYEVSTEDYKFVERLMPFETVPDPPANATYPTPSGWIPPKKTLETEEYFVQRTRNHMLPVYLQTSHGGSRKLVMIRKVHGDIWAFEAAIRKHLEGVLGKRVATQVHEVGRFIRVKGLLLDEVSNFLVSKGF